MPQNIFVRTCQECGHKQESKPISEYKGESWTETKCKKCKSSSLDYGSDSYTRDSNGKIQRIQSTYDEEGEY